MDESVLDYYVVLPMDDCGHIPADAAILGYVAKSTVPPICCVEDMYQININMQNFAFTKIVVVPAGSSYRTDFLDDGVLIDLVDLTTTTTTSMTSTTTFTTTGTSMTMTSTVTTSSTFTATSTATSRTASTTSMTGEETNATTERIDESAQVDSGTTKAQPVQLVTAVIMILAALAALIPC